MPIKNLSKIFTKEEVIPEVLVSLRWKFPDKINVKIIKSKDGGYIATVDNLPGCMTQAETGQELFEMVNDALYTYYDIPPQYIPYLPTFLPPDNIRETLKITIPSKFLEKDFSLQKV